MPSLAEMLPEPSDLIVTVFATPIFVYLVRMYRLSKYHVMHLCNVMCSVSVLSPVHHPSFSHLHILYKVSQHMYTHYNTCTYGYSTVVLCIQYKYSITLCEAFSSTNYLVLDYAQPHV